MYPKHQKAHVKTKNSNDKQLLVNNEISWNGFIENYYKAKKLTTQQKINFK